MIGMSTLVEDINKLIALGVDPTEATKAVTEDRKLRANQGKQPCLMLVIIVYLFVYCYYSIFSMQLMLLFC